MTMQPLPLCRRETALPTYGRPSRPGFLPQLRSQAVRPTRPGVQTPLNEQAWQLALASHPDRTFVRYLIRGISYGFRISFNRSCPLQSSHQNMLSAHEHPEVVQAYLDKERSTPTDLDILPALHVNRFGVIPKGHNKWR